MSKKSDEKKKFEVDLPGIQFGGLDYYDPTSDIKKFEEEQRAFGDELMNSYRESIAEKQNAIAEKEAEELRRHNEQLLVLKEQNQHLLDLVNDSKNAVEQRDAIIHFIVQTILAMESPKEEKKKSLTEILTRVASLTTTGSDMVSIIKFIAGSINDLSKNK